MSQEALLDRAQHLTDLVKIQIYGKGTVRDKDGKIKGEITFEAQPEVTPAQKAQLEALSKSLQDTPSCP